MPRECQEKGYVSKYLTHFVGQGRKKDEAFELLCKIIKDGKLFHGGLPEHWPGNVRIRRDLPLSSNKLLNPESVCFCDIPLNQEMLSNHTREYSQFGLAFKKKWLARERGANPVFYIALGSSCTEHQFVQGHPMRETTRQEFFDSVVPPWEYELRRTKGKEAIAWSKMENLAFWYFLCYCQFFDERLEQNDPTNYYMEREWRTIGQVCFEQEDIKRVILPESHEGPFMKAFPGLNSKVCLIRTSEAEEEAPRTVPS